MKRLFYYKDYMQSTGREYAMINGALIFLNAAKRNIIQKDDMVKTVETDNVYDMTEMELMRAEKKRGIERDKEIAKQLNDYKYHLVHNAQYNELQHMEQLDALHPSDKILWNSLGHDYRENIVDDYINSLSTEQLANELHIDEDELDM